MDYDRELQKLRQEILRKKSLETKLEELQRQYVELRNRADEFEKIMRREQADVDRLEGKSFSAALYTMFGNKEAKLDKEKAEAYAAKLKYDSAKREFELLTEDIGKIRVELREISGCEQRYDELLQKKINEIKAKGLADAIRIFNLEACIAEQKNRRKEVAEAISAGSMALRSAESILSDLDEAEGWGTWDLLGGGLIADMAKYDYLDDAEEKMEKLRDELRRFRTELADVTVYADIQTGIDSFLRFADYFFDGLFMDWAVLDKISQYKSKVQSTKSQIERLLANLRAMEKDAEKTVAKLEAEKDAVALNATL